MAKEILAGLSTFFTAAYLLILYPQILQAAGIDGGAALTACILTTFLSTMFLALYADFPVLLAPGLSVAIFLSYSSVASGAITWQTALGIVFWSGLLLFLLTVFKIRQQILHQIPSSIRSAIVAGIGLFLIFVSLKNLSGVPLFSLQNCVVAFGILLFFLLRSLSIKGSFLLTILGSWAAAIFLKLAKLENFVDFPPSIAPTFAQLDLLSPFYPASIGAFLSVLLISLFDTSASIAALAKLAKRLDRKSQVKGISKILIPDGLGSMAGAVLGSTTLAYTLESSSGIKEGGRGKTTAITAAICTLLGLFFYPVISHIPLFATMPVVMILGGFMALTATEIQWNKKTEWIPSLLILIITPATLSIYLGFAIGIAAYTLLKTISKEAKEVHPILWTLDILFGMHLVYYSFT